MFARNFRNARVGMVVFGLVNCLSLTEASSLPVLNGDAGIATITSQSLSVHSYATDLSAKLIEVNLYGKRAEQAGGNYRPSFFPALNSHHSIFGNVLDHAWAGVTAVIPQEWSNRSVSMRPLPYGTQFFWNDLLAMKSLRTHDVNRKLWGMVPSKHQTAARADNSLNLRTLPTPGLLLLLGTGFVGLALWRRQVRRRESTIRALFGTSSPSDTLFLQQAFSQPPSYRSGHNHAAPRTPLESP